VIEAAGLQRGFPPATDGHIAVNNLESACQQSWSRFWRAPEQPGVAELIVEQEQLVAQFLGDVNALERLEALVNQLDRVGDEPMRTALIHAQVASMEHRFAEARDLLAHAKSLGAPRTAAERLSFSINQACGTRLEDVLAARRRMAESRRLEDLVPLGALLADLREFDEADWIYQRALLEYRDVWPFAPAWVCFQLGVLWGELIAEPQLSRAAQWYRKAIEYLPNYVKARVHLAETYLDWGRPGDAEALLIPALSSGDPEVHWRLADVLTAMGKDAEAEAQIQTARSRFEDLLRKHLLAFADHGAEFYAGSGNDAARALDLARVNVENRPTLRAYEQAYSIAAGAGDERVACEILGAATERWAKTAGFRRSPLASA